MAPSTMVIYLLLVVVAILTAIIIDLVLMYRKINRRNMHLEHCYLDISYIVHDVLEDNDYLLHDCSTRTKMFYVERASEHIKKLNNRLTSIRRDLKYGDYHADIVRTDSKGDTPPEKS